MSFWAAYAFKLAILAMAMAALYVLAHRLRNTRWWRRSPGGSLRVLESAMLAPHATIHLVRAGNRYLLLGVGAGILAEISPDELDVTPRST